LVAEGLTAELHLHFSSSPQRLQLKAAIRGYIRNLTMFELLLETPAAIQVIF
jgi:hypothetical protein